MGWTAHMPHEPAPPLSQLAREVADVRPLGAVAARALALTEGDRFSAHDLASAIATDTGLTARLLRLANSAYYGFPRRIATVRDAVVLLGFREVRSTLIASSLIDSMSGATVLDRQAFWNHSVTVGLVAETLAQVDGRSRGEAFTAGVLHNIGRLALDQHTPELLRAAIRLACDERMPLHEAERAVLGYASADLGATLAERWNFPRERSEAVRWQSRRVDELPAASSAAAQLIRARDFVRSHGLDDGANAMFETPAPESEILAVAALLERKGGFESILQRVKAFLEHVSSG